MPRRISRFSSCVSDAAIASRRRNPSHASTTSVDGVMQPLVDADAGRRLGNIRAATLRRGGLDQRRVSERLAGADHELLPPRRFRSSRPRRTSVARRRARRLGDASNDSATERGETAAIGPRFATVSVADHRGMLTATQCRRDCVRSVAASARPGCRCSASNRATTSPISFVQNRACHPACRGAKLSYQVFQARERAGIDVDAGVVVVRCLRNDAARTRRGFDPCDHFLLQCFRFVERGSIGGSDSRGRG